MNAPASLAGARWAQRLPAETFASIEELLDESRARKQAGQVWPLDLRGLQAIPLDDRVGLVVEGTLLQPTAQAASQLSQRVGLPVQTVHVLSPELGAAALNERIAATASHGDRHTPPLHLLVEPQPDTGTTLRAITSHRYARVWDADVIEALVAPLAEDGWLPARTDGRGSRAPVGLFRSDRDLFCFLVHPGPEYRLPGAHGRPLQRGIVVRNSEVGGIALRVRAFWFDSWCTNHMVFGGSTAFDFAVAHREGNQTPLARLQERWSAAGGAQALADETDVAAAQMRRAAETLLTPWTHTPEETAQLAAEAFADLARQFQVRRTFPLSLLRSGASLALTYAGPDDLGLSLWHMACGLTQAVQGRTRHSDERMAVDEAVGRVLAAA